MRDNSLDRVFPDIQSEVYLGRGIISFSFIDNVARNIEAGFGSWEGFAKAMANDKRLWS